MCPFAELLIEMPELEWYNDVATQSQTDTGEYDSCSTLYSVNSLGDCKNVQTTKCSIYRDSYYRGLFPKDLKILFGLVKVRIFEYL